MNALPILDAHTIERLGEALLVAALETGSDMRGAR